MDQKQQKPTAVTLPIETWDRDESAAKDSATEAATSQGRSDSHRHSSIRPTILRPPPLMTPCPLPGRFGPSWPAAAAAAAAAAFFRCVSACFIMWSFRMKPLPHCSQAYGFEPLCRHMCRRRSVLWLNCFGHCSHLNGFSPPCFARCSSYDWLQGKRLPHR
uniref:Uncharacterized protein n=1 Tax=Anopheles melas TaxID=34690 RepID=A0A182TNE0_9DIPT